MTGLIKNLGNALFSMPENVEEIKYEINTENESKMPRT